MQECKTFTYPKTNDSQWIPLVRTDGVQINHFNFFLSQGMLLTMDVRNISQYAIFVHQHKHVYPECAEPYGLHSIKVAPNTELGVLEQRGFIIKDTMMKGLPREGLPCHEASEDEVLGYDKGIGECIDSKFIYLS